MIDDDEHSWQFYDNLWTKVVQILFICFIESAERNWVDKSIGPIDSLWLFNYWFGSLGNGFKIHRSELFNNWCPRQREFIHFGWFLQSWTKQGKTTLCLSTWVSTAGATGTYAGYRLQKLSTKLTQAWLSGQGWDSAQIWEVHPWPRRLSGGIQSLWLICHKTKQNKTLSLQQRFPN